jgi:hypothetical protein
MPLDLENIRTIFHQDKNEIIKEYGGTGAGIGKKNNEYCIVVYVDDDKKKSDKTLFWKNIPVRIEYVGKIIIQK